MGKMGWVYFIATWDKVKIGFSKEPRRRYELIKWGCSEKTEPLGVVRGQVTDETKWHARFKGYHSHREWYWRTPIVELTIAERAEPWDGTMSTEDLLREAHSRVLRDEDARLLRQWLNRQCRPYEPCDAA